MRKEIKHGLLLRLFIKSARELIASCRCPLCHCSLIAA